MKKIYFITILLFIGIDSNAQNSGLPVQNEDSSVNDINSVIVRSKSDGLFKSIPGSIATLSMAEIKKTNPISANEMFRKISGIHVVDEEGAGMRVNIGMRGMDPDRSRGVLVLEDGIPVSLNPYGEPEMYYSPIIDRMSGIEVLKGSGQIMFGPQTIGGVVNYITMAPTPKQSIRVKLGVGEGGFASSLFNYSNSFDKLGVVVTLLHRQADKLGYAKFGITDFSTKLVYDFNRNTQLMVKIGLYNELSNSTYIGLTQTMYDQGGQDFVLMAPEDRLDIKRYSLSATFNKNIGKKLKFNTTIFGYNTSRNWQRQEFSSSKTASKLTGVVWGDTSLPNGAVYMRNLNAHRNRQFEVFGAESKLTYQYQLWNKKSDLNVGVRYLFERAYEQRLNGKKLDSRTGDLVEDEIRTGNAFSAYAQNKMNLSKKIILSFGLRLESYNYQRNIFRNTFLINNVSKMLDTNLLASNEILTLIPGAGINYQMSKNMNLFGGAHKGYAPPRVKDAISASGQAYQLEAESSWNYELGLRGALKKVLSFELTGFYMDFSNQIIPVSESSGGTGAGLINGGETIHKGLELSYNVKLSDWFKTKSKIVFNNNITLVNAYFSEDRYVKQGASNVNINGNKTPYAPEYYLNYALNYETKFNLGFIFSANYTGSQYGDVLNTTNPSFDGRIGRLKKYSVYDVNLYYKSNKLKTTFNFTVKNVFDERYIVSRRPQGIRVGLPRYFMGTVQIDL
jgi:Fe(3+) dicitrate transport protein